MCPFSQEVWKGVLMLESDKIELPGNIPNLIRNWVNLSLFDLSKKHLLKTSWMWIPKFICWKLWMERNNRIFGNERCNPTRVIIKVKAFLGEALEANTAIKNEKVLDSEEDLWFKGLVPNHKWSSLSGG